MANATPALAGHPAARGATAPCADAPREPLLEGTAWPAAVRQPDSAGHRDVARHCRDEPDERLVELCRAGREDAFDEIVERYETLLHRHCTQLVGGAAAQDAVQEALLSAWTAIRAGAEVHALRSWLFTIAHRKALTILREPRCGSLELSPSLTAGRSPADEANQSAQMRQTLAALAELPGPQREALLGTAVHGRSGRQIARDLGISDGTVRQLVCRARATLRTTAAACCVPPIFAMRLLRGAASSPSRLAALVRSALQPDRLDLTGKLFKASAVTVIALTLVGSGAFHLIGSPHRAPSRTRPHVAQPTRPGQPWSATLPARRPSLRRFPLPSARRSDSHTSTRRSHSHTSANARHRARQISSIAPTSAAPRSTGPSSTPASGRGLAPGSSWARIPAGPTTTTAPPSITTAVNGTLAPAGLAHTVTPLIPPAVVPGAQTGTPATHDAQPVTQAVQAAGNAAQTTAVQAAQTVPGAGLLPASSVSPPVQAAAPATTVVVGPTAH